MVNVYEIEGYDGRDEKEKRMCEKTDWLGAIGDLDWAVGSLEELFERGSSEREIFRNAARGIKDRLKWIQSQALAETKRKLSNGRNLVEPMT